MTRNAIGACLAGLGVLIIVTELLQHWFRVAYPIGGAVVAVGAALGFVGFYMLSPKEAEDGGGFLVDSTVKILNVVRGGRRSTDTPVVTAAPAKPDAMPGEGGPS